MSEEKKTTNQVKILTQDIYKVHILNEYGLTGSIILFCRSNINNFNISEIFSESEIREIKEKNIDLIYSEGVLHQDDSISTIKKKIIHELRRHAVSITYEEMYLFTLSLSNIHSIYDSIVALNQTMNKESLNQLFINMNLEEEERENLMSKIKDTNRITYDDFRSLMDFDEKYKWSIPLGQKFSKEMNYFFSANPFKLISPEVGLTTEKNPLISLENNLLLNYGELFEHNLYVCRIRDVIKYCEKS